MKALTCITKALKKQLHTYELVHSHKCIAHWFWLHLFWPLEDRVLQCLWVTALSTGRIVIGMIYVGNRSTITTSLLPLSNKSHTIKFHMRVKEKAPHALIELPKCTAYLPVGATYKTR